MAPIEDLFRDIDARWKPTGQGQVTLCLIGSAALMLQANYERGTKDSDVLETRALSADAKRQLLALAGPNTPLAVRRRLFIDVVNEAIPFLPQRPHVHPLIALNQDLKHLQLEVLDVVDVVVSKLKRLSRSDLADIDAMIEHDRVAHERLIERFVAAVDAYSMDARADDLPRYVQNLHRVERDLFGVAETDIKLPGWV